MKKYSNQEVSELLAKKLAGWSLEKGRIYREFEFKNFAEAFSFMTAVALEADKMDHHPDWCNAYNKVSITLATHSVNGITQKDFDLADKIDSIFKIKKSEP